MPTLYDEVQGSFCDESKQEIKESLGGGPTLVLGCMDLRYCLNQRHAFREVSPELQRYDLVSFAGSTHMLGKPREVRGGISLGELSILYDAAKIITAHSIRMGIKFHNISQIIITSHLSCGHVAWEGYSFSSLPAEEEKHRGDRTTAAEWVQSLFPNLKTWTCLSFLDQKNHVYIRDLRLES